MQNLDPQKYFDNIEFRYGINRFNLKHSNEFRITSFKKTASPTTDAIGSKLRTTLDLHCLQLRNNGVDGFDLYEQIVVQSFDELSLALPNLRRRHVGQPREGPHEVADVAVHLDGENERGCHYRLVVIKGQLRLHDVEELFGVNIGGDDYLRRELTNALENVQNFHNLLLFQRLLATKKLRIRVNEALNQKFLGESRLNVQKSL